MALFVFYILYPSLPPASALRPPSQLLTNSNNPLFISCRAETRRTTQRRTPEEIINSTQTHTIWLVGSAPPVCPCVCIMIHCLYLSYYLQFIWVCTVICQQTHMLSLSALMSCYRYLTGWGWHVPLTFQTYVWTTSVSTVLLFSSNSAAGLHTSGGDVTPAVLRLTLALISKQCEWLKAHWAKHSAFCFSLCKCQNSLISAVSNFVLLWTFLVMSLLLTVFSVCISFSFIHNFWTFQKLTCKHKFIKIIERPGGIKVILSITTLFYHNFTSCRKTFITFFDPRQFAPVQCDNVKGVTCSNEPTVR